MSYPTLAEVKTSLGILTTADDAKLTQLMAWTEEVIHEYLGRDLNLAEYTHNSYKPLTEMLQLDNYPVPSVTSITMDGDTKTVSDYHLVINEGILYGDFTSCDVLVIVYQGGYTTLPGPIYNVFCSIIEDQYADYKGISEDDIKDITIFDFAKVSFDTTSSGGNSVSYSGVSSTGHVPAILEPYLGTLNLYRSNTVVLSASGVR